MDNPSGKLSVRPTVFGFHWMTSCQQNSICHFCEYKNKMSLANAAHNTLNLRNTTTSGPHKIAMLDSGNPQIPAP